MRLNLKRCVWALTVAVGIGIGAGTIQAIASPTQDRAPEKDYSKTKTYQQGLREGKDDHDRNLDHSKKRHFKKDEDQKAYESGYQKGRGN